MMGLGEGEKSIASNSKRLLKGALVAILCTSGAVFRMKLLSSSPLSLEEDIPDSIGFQTHHPPHENNQHQRLRRNLAQRKLLYHPKREKRELKLLQEDYVDCSTYQYTLAITDKLRINYVLDVEESSPGGGTFKAEMVYQGQAWLGFAHSEQGGMEGSLAIIGDPEASPESDYQVQKYRLAGKGLQLIQPLPTSNQTLLDTELIQTEDTTIMRFTKLLSEPSELTIHPKFQNTFLFAHGSSNTLGMHETRGVLILDLVPCLPSRRDHSAKPGDRLEQDPEDRYEATSNYIISVGGTDSSFRQDDPSPVKPIGNTQPVPEKKPPIEHKSSSSSSQPVEEPSSFQPEEPQQYDIPDQFTVDDDRLKNLPLSYTHPTKGIKIWWTIHGFSAMLTCGILLPIVIAATMLQGGCCGSGKKGPRYHSSEIHRWSNFLLLLSVLATFITAVIATAKDTNRNDTPVEEEAVTYVDTISPQPIGHKPETYHSPAGLALFLVCLFFALTGNLRSYLTTAGWSSPSQASPGEEKEEQGSDFNSDTIKSEPPLTDVARRWDQCHCLIGVVLLFVSFWQCQSGLDVFEYRFADSWFTRKFFWGVSGTCTGVFGFACIMQLVYLLLQWCYKAAYW